MGEKRDDIKERMFSWLLSEIIEAQEIGVPVTVDGRTYSVQDAEQLHGVMEEQYYMKSYVGDQRGKIVRIDFDHIEGV